MRKLTKWFVKVSVYGRIGLARSHISNGLLDHSVVIVERTQASEHVDELIIQFISVNWIL